MSIIKNMHRIICDIEELQDRLSKADEYRVRAEIDRDAACIDADALAGMLRKVRNECSMHYASYTLSPQDFTEMDIMLAKHAGGK